VILGEPRATRGKLASLKLNVRYSLRGVLQKRHAFGIDLWCSEDDSRRSLYDRGTQIAAGELCYVGRRTKWWDTCLSNSEKCSRITPICTSKLCSRSPMISSCISLCAFARANVSFPCWRRMDMSLPMTCPCASLRFRSWPNRWAVRRS
jgi:hypothetical protein